MDEIRSLQERVRALEDIEAIKKLRARYWLSLDRKRWDDFGECFTEDVIMDVPPTTCWQGKTEMIQNLSNILASIITVHQGHHADIDLTSDTTAKATWAMYDHLQDKSSNTKIEGYGYYEDEYVKEHGVWKIKKLKLSRFFMETKGLDSGS